MYRADGPSVLGVFDVASQAFVDKVEVGLRPFDVLISADGDQVYTVDHDAFTVTIVVPNTLASTAVEVAPFGTSGGLASWEKPHYAVVEPSDELVLPYQGHALLRLDPDTHEIDISEMTANAHQHGVALTGDGRLLVVGTGAFGNADGAPSLTIIRKPGHGHRTARAARAVDENITAWTDPRDGRRKAIFAGGYTRPGGWDGVTIVDLETHEITELAVPGYPQTIVPLAGD